ncbi:hypothetical protein QBC40DRAFT_279624 [Triangularia verruculosa]|uniref:Uncharacterized protein n=1 Tax=Triangularia verruculosa TaxID=2587418 RepID=A0AAN6XH97_9PEZI|nr:hypothetical protein QBC40DRAFT_279624 [Triangularia verruculosa]
MASKRDHSALLATDYDDTPSSSSNKRRREQPPSKSKQLEAKTDPTYGQRTAFPGLDDDGNGQFSDEDLEFEECDDALAYLKSVRQEASHVPHIIVAPKAGPQLPPHIQSATASDTVNRSLYDDGVGDSRGYYQDGAYTAAPDPSPISSQEEGTYLVSADTEAENKRTLSDAYYASLTDQFLALRALLHREPPQELIDALDKDHGIEVGSFGPKSWTFRVWTKRIRYTDPLPVQIAALDRQSVLKILRVILGGKFIRRGYELRERTSRWLWALLARLPDRGVLDHTEVGWVRDLGKRAVLMMVSIAHMAALQEEVNEELEGDELGEDEEDGELHPDDDDMELESCETVGISDDNNETTSEVSSTNAIANTDMKEPEDGEMDMDLDEGEVSDEDDNHNQDIEADLAAAKARILSQLEDRPEQEQEPPLALEEEVPADEEGKPAFDETRARLNMRATLNMILTVAGEFYGQRDLLEFRDPFPAL